MKTRTCPACRGKGHSYDAASLVAPLTLLIAWFERNDPKGVTRERCKRCGGTGWIRQPSGAR